MSDQQAGPHRVVVPQDNVSDDRYLLLAWTATVGGHVAAGDVLGEFETSKSILELQAGAAGVFHPLAEEGEQVAIGQVVAVLADRTLTPDELAALVTPVGVPEPGSDTPPVNEHDQAPRTAASADPGGVRFSKAAEALITEHGLDRREFAGLGLVRGTDVERHLAAAAETIQAEARSDASPPAQVRGSAIVVVGAGGHARMILDLLAELRCFQVVGLLDDGVATGQLVNGHRVLGPASPEQLAKLHGDGVRLAVNAVGGVTRRPLRPAVYQRIRAAGFGLPTLVHPQAVVDASAQLSEGAQILANSYVGASTVVGEDCIINNGTVVAHDCTVKDHAHVAPGAILAGGVTVGRNALIGMGVTVYLGVAIGADAIVANGVDVFADVADGDVVRRTHQ